MALHEMNPGYRRQALQIVHAETQRTIHHAVDREAMLRRIDVGEMGRVVLHEVERGRGDDSPIILKRRVVSDVIDAESGPSAQELAVVVGFLALCLRLGRLAFRGPFRAGSRACSYASQCSSAFQEPPPARSIGFHDCLP